MLGIFFARKAINFNKSLLICSSLWYNNKKKSAFKALLTINDKGDEKYMNRVKAKRVAALVLICACLAGMRSSYFAKETGTSTVQADITGELR